MGDWKSALAGCGWGGLGGLLTGAGIPLGCFAGGIAGYFKDCLSTPPPSQKHTGGDAGRDPEPQVCPPLNLSFYVGDTPVARLLEGHNLTVRVPYGSNETFYANHPVDSFIGGLSAYTNANAYCTGKENVLWVSGEKFCKVDRSYDLGAGTFNPGSREFYIQRLEKDVSVVLQGGIPGVEEPCRYFIDIAVSDQPPH